MQSKEYVGSCLRDAEIQDLADEAWLDSKANNVSPADSAGAVRNALKGGALPAEVAACLSLGNRAS